jgi:2-polyprenyl-6-methoxyphenol hydroxylase-like FAD-dependent oxidoreductase
MGKAYDAIIVGTRCAGSPMATLLARKGYRILAIDRATFPSDTPSTHVVQPLGVAALSRWGLLDRLVATGCPPIDTYSFDFGPFTIAGAPGTKDAPVAYCPRRTVLDKLLVDAAAEAGAEIREGFTVEEVLTEDGRVVGIKGHSEDGNVVTENATVVIGADGRNSLVAKAVGAKQYSEKPPLLAAYYSYWSDLPMDGRFENYIRPNCGFAAAPTHDGMTVVVAGWPYSELADNKTDIEGNYLKVIGLAPEFAERLRDAKREVRALLGRPLAANAPAAQPEGRIHVGSDDETGRRLASNAAYPSSLARAALRRQTPEVRAGCSNRACPDLCGGCPVMGIPTAILGHEEKNSQ